MKSFVGVRADAAAAPTAAPPRIRPTTFDTSDRDGAEILAHIFNRVPIVVDICETADSCIVDLDRNPPAPKGRKKIDPEDEQGATARVAVVRRCPCGPANGEFRVIATLPKAVTGAINVSNNNCVAKGNFAIV